MFLELQDLDTTLYPEIRQAISRNQEAIVWHHINEAVGYLESRLAAKYDVADAFSRTADARHPLLLKYAKDIAVYFLYDLPETIPLKRVKAYEDAVKWLDDLVAGRAVLAGVLPAPATTTTSGLGGTISAGSEEKRRNQF